MYYTIEQSVAISHWKQKCPVSILVVNAENQHLMKRLVSFSEGNSSMKNEIIPLWIVYSGVGRQFYRKAWNHELFATTELPTKILSISSLKNRHFYLQFNVCHKPDINTKFANR